MTAAETVLPRRVVVDASVAVKWFIPEEHAEGARRLLTSDIVLLAPDLIWSEVGNVLWRKVRDGYLTDAVAQSVLADFQRFPLHIRTAVSLYHVAWPLARACGRTFYDSLYLALALSEGAQMVTGDLRFHHATQATQWARSCEWIGNLP